MRDVFEDEGKRDGWVLAGSVASTSRGEGLGSLQRGQTGNGGSGGIMHGGIEMV